MKKFKSSFHIRGLIVCTIFIMFSCNMNPDFVDKQVAAPAVEADGSAMAYPGPVLSYPISLNRVDIFTNISNTLTGTVTVQITNGLGTVVGSTTVWGSSLVKGEG